MISFVSSVDVLSSIFGYGSLVLGLLLFINLVISNYITDRIFSQLSLSTFSDDMVNLNHFFETAYFP